MDENPSFNLGMIWTRVGSCGGVEARSDLAEDKIWPLILQVLATNWNLKLRDLNRRLHDHHTHLPRGRVVHPKLAYVAIHGDDAHAAVRYPTG